MKYLDLFSGYGGFPLGINRAYAYLSKTKGIQQGGTPQDRSSPEQSQLATEQPTCIGYSEIDKYAIQIYDKHYSKHKNYGDITKIDATLLPDFDLLVGGFPCQAFSIAGKRGGFNDTRGTLFFDIVRIIREKQPRLILLENVKGLLSHEKGSTFYTIITTLDELGYDLQWQVLNSKNFGVPQNRERVFVVGHLRGTPRPQVFPLGEMGEENTGPDTTAQAINNPSRGYEARKDGLGACVRAGQMGSKNIILHNIYGGFKEGRARVFEKIVPTIRTAKGGGHIPSVLKDARIRRLTPLECERLMGLPDNWTEGVSDTQRYKLCGNGVVVNVVEEIMKKLL